MLKSLWLLYWFKLCHSKIAHTAFLCVLEVTLKKPKRYIVQNCITDRVKKNSNNNNKTVLSCENFIKTLERDQENQPQVLDMNIYIKKKRINII